jgi:hypothetical protein
VPTFVEQVSACVGTPDDYRPRDQGSATDAWPACVSDANVYTPINPSVSSVARVAAFEQMADLLWRGDRVPSAQDFIDARVLYAQDQGLDSRVQRREDVHYAAAPMACSAAGVPAQHPDRCVGPARLLPVLNDAFAKGAAGDAPQVQAARIDAALTWFLYVSALSEVVSCTSKAQDCDSAWAYYSGGTPRALPLGLAKAVQALAPETHERAYDATLAVRCWRNLDHEAGVATDLARRDRALAQLDRALVRGVAVLLRQRVAELPCSSGQTREARLAWVQVVAPLLDRALRERDAARADLVSAELGRAAAQDVDAAAVTAALDAVFPCP